MARSRLHQQVGNFETFSRGREQVMSEKPGIPLAASGVNAETYATRYSMLPGFLAMGQPDVILSFQDGANLPTHAKVVEVHSGVLRDVIKGTVHQHNDSGSEHWTASVIHLGSNDVETWSCALTGLYSFVDGAADDHTWDSILVSVSTTMCTYHDLNPKQTGASSDKVCDDGKATINLCSGTF